MFHHPSPELDGKDKISYIIENLKRGVPNHLKKKIVEDYPCLKAGRISGKYKPLINILNDSDIKEINSIILRRRSEFLKSYGVFPTRKK